MWKLCLSSFSKYDILDHFKLHLTCIPTCIHCELPFSTVIVAELLLLPHCLLITTIIHAWCLAFCFIMSGIHSNRTDP